MTRPLHRAILNAIPPTSSRAEIPATGKPSQSSAGSAPDGRGRPPVAGIENTVAPLTEEIPGDGSPGQPSSPRGWPGTLIPSSMIDEALANVTFMAAHALDVRPSEAREAVVLYALQRCIDRGCADTGRLRDHILTILAEPMP